MTAIDRKAVESAIRQYRDPYLETDLLSLGAVRELTLDGSTVRLDIELPYPCEGIKGAMQQLLTTQLEEVDGVEQVAIHVAAKVRPHRAANGVASLANVRNVIAVASGKGGVGKSTTAVNLALALASEGASTGILDADIYGPSIGMMLGIPERTRPETRDEKYFVPLLAHGVQAMSMSFVVTDKTPMVWRGPMVSGALQQLLGQTLWRDLDYLVVDLPPGTGDIQLTLAQKVPVTGAVIVTTPQDIALLDGQRGIEMFRKVKIPVLGVVENMSQFICSHCGHQEPLFGEHGGERLARDYETELLAQLPLHRTIREQTDSGTPSVVAEPDSEVARTYREMARRVGAAISQLERDMSAPIATA